MLLQQLSTVAMFAVAIVFARATIRNHGQLAVAYVATLPWFGMQADLGLTLSVDRVGALLMLAVLMVRHSGELMRICGAFATYMVAATAAMSISLPQSVETYEPLRGKYRWLFQVAYWSLALAPAAGIPVLIRSRAQVRHIYQSLLVSIGILASLGLLQWAIFFLSGVDIFPIGGASGQLLRSAISKQDFLFSQQLSLRISSLGGEPKHLAVSLVLALTILAANALANNPLGLSRLLAWVVVSFAGLALLLTQSTQGYILAAVNGALIMVLGRVVGLRPKGRRAVMLIGTIITIGAVVATNPSVQELILHRTTVRFEETGYLEDTNEIAIAWLNDNPTYGIFGVGLGNLQFYAAAYIPDYASEYLTGGIVVAKSGALRVITELGVVGLIILLGTYAPPLVRLSRLSPVSRGTLGSFQLMVAITVLVDFLLVFDGPLFLFAMLGLTHLVVRACEERGRSDPLLVRGRG